MKGTDYLRDEVDGMVMVNWMLKIKCEDTDWLYDCKKW
jgi:hypothetical protein